MSTKNIIVYKSRYTPIEKQKIEIVERKGLGHPDYIADSIAEEFSRSLSAYYLEKFGRVLHHNVDKLEVIGGKTAPAFGGGKVIKPISILFSGRATDDFNGNEIPVREIAVAASNSWISKNLRFLNPDSIEYFFETKSGSANLSSAFERKGKIGSNDTSFGVGYAPFSETENLALEIERYANSKEFKHKFPFSGEDIKVMCVRKNQKIDITIAMAFIDKYVNSASDYRNKKTELLAEITKKFGYTQLERKIKIVINAMDKPSLGVNGCYLTVTGSSAEHGDDGAVGRGNRVNGLITPNRPMSLEASAGKNPINHVGKIYNLLSVKLAQKIYKTFNLPINVRMVGRIGTPLDNPLAIAVETNEKISDDIKKRVTELINDELSRIDELTKEILSGKVSVC
jgi:S-adenosylmethionine synthetase